MKMRKRCASPIAQKEKKVQNSNNWRRLDNSAKIFPIASSKKYSSVFRLSAVLKEEINASVLKEAVNLVLKHLQSFKVKLKKGAFWYYFEDNSKEIIIEEEKDYPCKYIDPNTNNDYLFKVTYWNNKINLDIFHSLTDGNSGVIFLREIVYTYIELAHKDRFTKALRIKRKLSNNTEDDYLKNYDKKSKGTRGSKKAYILKGKKLPLAAIGVIHININLEELKNKAKEKGVTITQYLTAALIYSIYNSKYKNKNGGRPIKVCIPVDLRKYFKSETVSNFFSYITVAADMKLKMLQNFEGILKFVKSEFERLLTKEEISKTMSANVKLGNNPFIKIIPLFLKLPIVKLSYLEIRKYTTTTFSNIGRIGIIGEYQKYIDKFLILIAPETVEKIKCSSCSFENNLVFTFTSVLQDTEVEEEFCERLKEEGININIEGNGVHDFISEG